MLTKEQRNKIVIEQKKFVNYLYKNNLRLTKARIEVFNLITKMDNHFGAEDLLKIKKDSVSRATLYRTLNELVKSLVIRKTAFGEKHQHFEFVFDKKPHHHAFCISCKENIDFPDFGEEKMYKKILKEKGFETLGHEMHFYGFCKECADKKT